MIGRSGRRPPSRARLRDGGDLTVRIGEPADARAGEYRVSWAKPPEPDDRERRPREGARLRVKVVWGVARGVRLAILAVTAALGLVLGVHDAVFGAQTHQRITGTLLAASAVALVAGCAFLPAWEPIHPLASLPLAGGSLIGAVLVVAQLKAEPDRAKLALWIVLALCPLVTALPIWISRSDMFNPTNLAVLVSLIAVLVGVMQNLFSSASAPIADRDSLTIQTQVAVVATVGADDEVEASFQIKNPSGSELLYLGAVYSLTGGNPSITRAAAPALSNSAVLAGFAGTGTGTAALFTGHPVTQLIATGKSLVTPGHWIPAGGENDGEVINFFPRGRYRYLIFRMQVATVRADRVQLGPPTRLALDRHFQLLYQNFTIISPSWVSRITQAPRFIETKYSLDPVLLSSGNGLTAVRASPTTAGQARTDNTADTRNDGLVEDGAVSYAALLPAQ